MGGDLLGRQRRHERRVSGPLTVDQFEKCITFGLQFQCVDAPASMPDPCLLGNSPACSG